MGLATCLPAEFVVAAVRAPVALVRVMWFPLLARPDFSVDKVTAAAADVQVLAGHGESKPPSASRYSASPWEWRWPPRCCGTARRR